MLYLKKKIRLPYEEWSIDEILTTDWTTMQQFPFVILIVGTIFFKKKTKETFLFFQKSKHSKKATSRRRRLPARKYKTFQF